MKQPPIIEKIESMLPQFILDMRDHVNSNPLEIKLSPSSSERYFKCAGSPYLVSKVNKPSVPKHYTAEGTVAHSVGEDCLNKNKQPWEFLGETREADGFKIVVSDNMVEACELFTDHIDRVVVRDSDVYVECHHSLEKLNVPKLKGGRTDTLIVSRSIKEVEAVDYKHGQGVAVDVDWNSQLLQYLLAAIIYLEESEKIDFTYWSLKITIVQPRAFHSKGRIRTFKLSYDELVQWAVEKLIPNALNCHNPEAPLTPSADACRFCDASPCSAQEKHINEMAVVDFETCEEITPVELMSVEQKIKILDNKALLQKIISDVEKSVYSEIDSGSKDYEGSYKLVRKKSNRSFIEDAFDPIMSPIFDYIEEEDAYEKKPKGITAIEDTLKQHFRDQGMKRGFSKIVKGVLDSVTEKLPGDPTLAPESDGRKALPPSSVRDFSEN